MRRTAKVRVFGSRAPAATVIYRAITRLCSEHHGSHMSAHTSYNDFKNTVHRPVFIKFDYAIVYEEFLRVTAPVDTPLIL